MEPANKGSANIYIYPPSPATTRGETTTISVSPDFSKIVYCSSTLVIYRDLQNLRACETFNEHLHETTCAKFSPNGTFVCSGDAKGNVKIWFADDSRHPLKKAFDNVLSGKIKDFAWTPDSQRLAICGEGQNLFGKVIIVDTGSGVGEVTGHSKTLLTCAFTPARPFKLITGGEDFNINLFEGPPFKFKHNDVKSHKNFVTCLRYSPVGDSFVSVSSDKKIVIHDPATADGKDEITDSPHAGTISTCEYIDANTLVTVSMDKTVKIWDLGQKKCIKKLIVHKNPTIDHMLLGAALLKDGLCSLSLNGALNFWRGISNLENDSLPTETVIGHQAAVNMLLYSDPLATLVSGDRNGRIIIWKDKKAVLPDGAPHVKQIAAARLSASRKGIYVASIEGLLKYLDIEKSSFGQEYNANVLVNGLAASKQDEKVCYLAVDKNKIIVVEDFKVKKEIDLNFEPLSIESSNDDAKLFVGNKDGDLFVIKLSTGEILNKLTHKSGIKLTTLCVSRNEDKFLVSGDSQKNIVLWNLADLSKITEDWVYHSASIQSLEFSRDNEKVISAGWDNSVIIWNTQTLKKEVEYRHMHKGGSLRALLLPGNVVVTSGADQLIKEFNA